MAKMALSYNTRHVFKYCSPPVKLRLAPKQGHPLYSWLWNWLVDVTEFNSSKLLKQGKKDTRLGDIRIPHSCAHYSLPCLALKPTLEKSENFGHTTKTNFYLKRKRHCTAVKKAFLCPKVGDYCYYIVLLQKFSSDLTSALVCESMLMLRIWYVTSCLFIVEFFSIKQFLNKDQTSSRRFIFLNDLHVS